MKKPKDLLEYVVVHEMAHLIEPTHSERFVALLSKHYPTGAKPARNSTSCRWRAGGMEGVESSSIVAGGPCRMSRGAPCITDDRWAVTAASVRGAPIADGRTLPQPHGRGPAARRQRARSGESVRDSAPEEPWLPF